MTTHVDYGRLAELVDGVLPSDEAAVVRTHLTQCRSCMAAYVDAVRYRAAWLADPQAFRADEQVLRLARGASLAPVSPSRRGSKAVAGWRVLQISVAALLVAWLGFSRFVGVAPSLQFELPPAVRAAAERSSARGLVLPGVTNADRLVPELRSGQITISPGLDREVRDAIETYENGVRDPDAGARVVAALLAMGEIEAARDYARECLRRSPGHVPLQVFAADACYRSNDLVGAEELLRNAAHRAPHDPVVALDLALVLGQLGRKGEARPLLMRVAKSRNAALAARAARELSRASRS